MALASFADWVASDPSLFPYGRDPRRGDYLKEALRLAQEALNRLGWPAFAKAQRREFGELFPYIPKPNALQESVPALLEGACTPVLLLVEAPMGMGKTEAALYAHHLLQAGLGHRGLYVALPTQATANGLFPRVRGFLERLGRGAAWSSSSSTAPPSSTPTTPGFWSGPPPARWGRRRKEGLWPRRGSPPASGPCWLPTGWAPWTRPSLACFGSSTTSSGSGGS